MIAFQNGLAVDVITAVTSPGGVLAPALNAVVRLASRTARQSSTLTCSRGRPTCPAIPPAQLTRMSTGPTAAKNSATAAAAGPGPERGFRVRDQAGRGDSGCGTRPGEG